MRYVIGRHACEEVFRIRPQSVEEIFVLKQTKSTLKEWKSDLVNRFSKVRLSEKPAPFFDKLGSGHQGFAIKCETLKWEDPVELKGPILVLDGIEDPQNFGAIIRTAWLLGVEQVLIPERRQVTVTSTVTKIASGGVEHVPVFTCAHLNKEIETLKKSGFWVYGAFPPEPKVQSLGQVQFDEKSVIVLGAEHSGIRKSLEKVCDLKVTIPQLEASASLNVGVSAAIFLAEFCRQWPQKL